MTNSSGEYQKERRQQTYAPVTVSRKAENALEGQAAVLYSPDTEQAKIEAKRAKQREYQRRYIAANRERLRAKRRESYQRQREREAQETKIPLTLCNNSPKYSCVIVEYHSQNLLREIHADIEYTPYESFENRYSVRVVKNQKLQAQETFATLDDAVLYLKKKHRIRKIEYFPDLSGDWTCYE